MKCDCMKCRAMVQFAGLTMLEAVVTDRIDARCVRRVADALARMMRGERPRDGDLDENRFAELAVIAQEHPRILRWVSTTVGVSGMSEQEATEAQAAAAAKGE